MTLKNVALSINDFFLSRWIFSDKQDIKYKCKEVRVMASDSAIWLKPAALNEVLFSMGHSTLVFRLFRLFYWRVQLNKKNSLIKGFEPRISGVKGYRSTNWATTTASKLGCFESLVNTINFVPAGARGVRREPPDPRWLLGDGGVAAEQLAQGIRRPAGSA